MESENFHPDPTFVARPTARGKPTWSGPRRTWRTLLTLLLIGGAVAWVSFRLREATTGSFHPTLQWLTDSRTAVAAATQADQPILMVFTQANCTYCRRLEKQVLETPAFEAVARGRVVLAMLDVAARRNLDLLEQFGGKGTPTVVLTNPQGDMIDFYPGDGKDLVNWLTTCLTAPRIPPSPGSQPATRAADSPLAP
jgi:thiol:disulfide interchange protein